MTGSGGEGRRRTTGESRLTRRGVLALGATTLAAGCSGLDGLLGPGEVRLDVSAVREATSGEVPEVTEPLPVDVAADYVEGSRASAGSDLESVPLPLSAEELPNGTMRWALGNEVEHARALLESATEAAGTRERLDSLRHAREHTRYVAAAWAYTNDEVTVGDVRERAGTVRENVESFREGWTYVGDDPVRVVLVGDAVESWTGAARRYATLDDPTFQYRPDSTLGVGERAGEVEHGHAYLADATHVAERFRASLSDPPSMREALTDARASLTETVESRLESVPRDVDDPNDLGDTDRDLDGTPAYVALDALRSSLLGDLEPTDNLTMDVVERVRDLAFAEGFTRLRDRVESGEEFGVTSAEEVGQRREAAVSAVEMALDESADRRLARRLLADELRHLVDADETLARHDGVVVTGSLHWELGGYLTLTTFARGVPPACRTALDALGIDS
jgi:hypothetical protein